MANREVHIELLLGRKVLDADGQKVGPIEEIIAEQKGEECVVKEYLIGRAALLQRLSAQVIGTALLRFLGAKTHGGYKVPWDKMDLSDPQRPRLECVKDELSEFDR